VHPTGIADLTHSGGAGIFQGLIGQSIAKFFG